MYSIPENIRLIRQRMQKACERAGRPADSVQLLLATKTVPVAKIKMALDAGERIIGENKVQEALLKYQQLAEADTCWHFIGHLQTNKVKEVLRFATLIHSVDRIELVQKLDKRLQFEGRSVDILIQVNTSFEASKFGVAPEKALSFIREAARYDTLRIKGLMTIGLFSAESDRVRRCFKQLKEIQTMVQTEAIQGVEMSILSMGMSSDLEAAIEEGATIVRVGTAIFGQRSLPDSYYWNEQANGSKESFTL